MQGRRESREKERQRLGHYNLLTSTNGIEHKNPKPCKEGEKVEKAKD